MEGEGVSDTAECGSGHFRLLDRENRRLMASFTLERVMERLKEELQ